MHSIFDVEREYPFQQRGWIVERVGWIALLIFLVAATLGAFGRGPLSRAHSATDDGALSIDCESVVRYQAPTQLRIRWRRTESAADIALSFSRRYWNQVVVRQVQPLPAGVGVNEHEIVYHFRPSAGAREAEIRFRIQMETVGPLVAQLSSDGRTLEIRQFVLP